MRPEPGRIIDYYQDWASARNYWSDVPIYTPHATSVPRYLGLTANPNPSIAHNMHPPTSVLLALPLGRLNYSDAALAWNVISLAALLASLTIVAVALSVPRSLCLPGLALLPFCMPVLGNLELDQINILLCFLLTAMWALERSGRSGMAASLLAAAAAIKLFPAYLAVYYLAQGRMRPLWLALVSFLTVALVTAFVLGWDTYHDYFTIVLPWNAHHQICGYNFSIAGFWHKLFDPVNAVEKIIPIQRSAAIATWGTALCDLVITAIVIALVRQTQTRSQRDLAFAITMTAMLLVSPVTWDVSLLLLLVPIAIIGHSLQTVEAAWMPAVLVVIVAIVWLPQPLLTVLATAGRTIDVTPPSVLLGAASLKFYALLATFILGLVTLRMDIVNAQRGAVDKFPVASPQ
jgi:hypothetical protein